MFRATAVVPGSALSSVVSGALAVLTRLTLMPGLSFRPVTMLSGIISAALTIYASVALRSTMRVCPGGQVRCAPMPWSARRSLLTCSSLPPLPPPPCAGGGPGAPVRGAQVAARGQGHRRRAVSNAHSVVVQLGAHSDGGGSAVPGPRTGGAEWSGGGAPRRVTLCVARPRGGAVGRGSTQGLETASPFHLLRN